MSDAYKAAGVDIDAGNEAVDRIRSHVKRTERPEVMGGIGGFGGAFALGSNYTDPVLISATDGVGTKLKLAFALDRHDTIGIDCVAMCVNDIVVQGAEPLFFLDYLATGKLKPEQVESVVKGIAEGCVQAGCALIGGETAEMPGMYAQGEYDVAGFAVGVVERERMLNGDTIRSGDVLVGLASNGLHSNGFSLARQVLLQDSVDSKVLNELLTPTRIYVSSFLKLSRQVTIKGAAHITGGGLVENLPRILPEGLQAEINPAQWKIPEIFHRIQQRGQISRSDMFRTFNMGIGMVLVVPAFEVESLLQASEAVGETAMIIGQVTQGSKGCIGWEEERS